MRIEKILEEIYFVFSLSLCLIMGLILGIFVFSYIPTLVSLFKTNEIIRNSKSTARLTIFKTFFKFYAVEIKKHLLSSLIYVVISGMITVNMLFYKSFSNIIFFLSAFILFLWIYFGIYYAYIEAFYEEYPLIEKIRSSFCMGLGYLLEEIIVSLLIFVLIYFTLRLSPALVFLLETGLIIRFYAIFIKNILTGRDLKTLIKNSEKKTHIKMTGILFIFYNYPLK